LLLDVLELFGIYAIGIDFRGDLKNSSLRRAHAIWQLIQYNCSILAQIVFCLFSFSMQLVCKMKKVTPNQRIVHQAKIVLQVQLDKQVPIVASLGGGSWNAATALWAASQRNENVPSEKTFRLGQ
jgi:uncharacterized SAM-binding protein YcdF (DUF218 family)